jgi:hypothetical protein
VIRLLTCMPFVRRGEFSPAGACLAETAIRNGVE